MLAAHSDEELLKTLSGVTIPFSGSSPFIHPVLLPTKKPQRNTFGKVKAKVLHSIKMPFGQVLQILQTDIAELNVDAVINPTNERLYMGGMVGSRLMAVGGPKFAKVIADARSEIQHLQKLDAFVTKGTGTKARNVLHVNGPVWDPNKTSQNLSDLSQCIQNCLKIAEQVGFTSIAFPSVGSGKANFPKAVAAEIIVGTIKTFLAQQKTNLHNISFVLFDQASIDAYVYELNRNT